MSLTYFAYHWSTATKCGHGAASLVVGAPKSEADFILAHAAIKKARGMAEEDAVVLLWWHEFQDDTPASETERVSIE